MIKNTFYLVLVVLLVSCNANKNAQVNLEKENSLFSYSLGLDIADNIGTVKERRRKFRK